MREVIAICQSAKAARNRAEATLDRYLWRVGDRTWRGRASTACLTRLAAELRSGASRATAVAVHEVKGGSHYREPIFTIGRKAAFGARGIVPVSSNPAQSRKAGLAPPLETARAALLLSAAFHDMGKASIMFQRKLRVSASTGQAIADPVRHELMSAALWDTLFGQLADADLPAAIASLTAEAVDAAWKKAASTCEQWRSRPDRMRPEPDFLGPGRELTRAIGVLILTHHRLPDSGSMSITAEQHVRRDVHFAAGDLDVAPGQRFWHEPSWLERVRDLGAKLTPCNIGMFDLTLRTCLMTADHLGSARKENSPQCPEHLANLKDGKWGDSLATHTTRVMAACRAAFDALVVHRDGWPAIPREAAPDGMIDHSGSTGRFAWQAEASAAAARVAATGGGFFGCIIAATGTGKTRGVPAVLAAAAFADPDPGRRRLRFCLGLGLRTLATQSARAYIADLGFHSRDITVALGQAPIEVPAAKAIPAADEDESPTGSAEIELSLQATEILRGDEIAIDSAREVEHLGRLSWSPEDELHPFIRYMMKKAGMAARERFFGSPILIGTIDQLAPSIMPARSRHLPASIRVMTSDLVIDEIDQLGPEDVAALCRLIRQAGACGRRVVIASATTPREIAEAAFASYRAGWADHAAFTGAPAHVSAVFAGDSRGAVVAQEECTNAGAAFRDCALLQCAAPDHPGRIPMVLEVDAQDGKAEWSAITTAVTRACDALHERHAAEVDGLRVSMGFVRLSRIRHAVAMARHLARGPTAKGVHRRVICLHSRMTGAMRGFIETEIRSALTRKGEYPNRGLREFIRRHGIDADARAEGAGGISIVVACTPVIETGNDVDFDWAVLDAPDARSVVQAAGRVMRHRPGAVTSPNIALLGIPLVVAETGRLENPGLETPHPQTCVGRLDLGEARGSARALLGPLCERIGARVILLREEGACLAADKEAELRRAFFEGVAPLAKFDTDVVARIGLGRLRARVFRRRSTPEVVIERDPETRLWTLDEWNRFGKTPVASRPGRPAPAAAAIVDPEAAALRRYEASGMEPPPALFRASLPATPDRISDRSIEITDDPFYGVLLNGQDPAGEFGKEV